MYTANPIPAVQYDFELDGGRTNQLLSLVNNTNAPISIQAIQIISNANIQNPWQTLSQQWSNVEITQQNNTYVYTLALSQPITLNQGENKLLEYSVGTAIGPITNTAMPPYQVAIQYQGNNQWQTLSAVNANNPQNNPHPNVELNMYHAEWGQYAYARNMSNEFWSDINCLTYAFIGFDIYGNVFSLDSWGDQLELPSLAIDKQALPYLKTSISFGGWTNNGQLMAPIYSQMAANPTARTLFVQNAVSAVIQAGVNGIDIDWEYPTATDAANYVTLLQELRTALTAAKIPNARLTIAAPAGKDNIQVFSTQQWQQISSVVDRISVMSYDYFGGFSDVADFHSPKALSSNSPHSKGTDSKYYCVEQTFAVYQQMGVNPNKLTMGIPNYARSMIVASPGQYAGLYQPVLGTPQGDFPGDNGVYSWNTIWNFLNKQPSALDALGVQQWNYYDSTHPLCVDAQMCMLSGQLPNGQWVVINFLDQTSATLRAQMATSSSLGGTMVWANYCEPLTQSNSITQAVSNGLNQQLHYQYHAQSSLPCVNHVRQKTAIEIATIKHANYLRSAFFAEDKLHILERLTQAKDASKMGQILKAHRKTLGQHRNILKRFISAIVPDALADLLFEKPRSLELAERFVANRQTIEWTKPNKIIFADKKQPDLIITPTPKLIGYPIQPPSYARLNPPPTYCSGPANQSSYVNVQNQSMWHSPYPSAPSASATQTSEYNHSLTRR
jgi:GH18 family chitinase